MILSLFLRNKEFHVSCGEFEHIYKVTESREMADNVPAFLKETMDHIDFSKCSKVIFSSGPASFTTARIMNSLVKGLKISAPNLDFLGISNFLTYLYIASQHNSEGSIALPTMRGDYFYAAFSEKKLSDIEIFSDLNQNTILDSNEIFDNINMSTIQEKLSDDNIVKMNPNYIQNSLDINYGFTPEYKSTPTVHR